MNFSRRFSTRFFQKKVFSKFAESTSDAKTESSSKKKRKISSFSDKNPARTASEPNSNISRRNFAKNFTKPSNFGTSRRENKILSRSKKIFNKRFYAEKKNKFRLRGIVFLSTCEQRWDFTLRKCGCDKSAKTFASIGNVSTNVALNRTEIPFGHLESWKWKERDDRLRWHSDFKISSEPCRCDQRHDYTFKLLVPCRIPSDTRKQCETSWIE